MEEYKNWIKLIAFPFALAKQSMKEEDLYSILDSADYMATARPASMINLNNCGSACALDSVITGLFAHFQLPKNKVYEDPHRQAIYQWFQQVSQEKNVKSLIALFRHFPHEEQFHVLGRPKDAVEFLMYLLKIFTKDITGTKLFKTVNEQGQVTCARVDKESTPVQYMSAIE